MKIELAKGKAKAAMDEATAAKVAVDVAKGKAMVAGLQLTKSEKQNES